jgi:hypothetical protein
MYRRESFHQCAEELENLSFEFKTFSLEGVEQGKCPPELEEISSRAFELLRSMAAAIRSEADAGLIKIPDHTVVGALVEDCDRSCIAALFQSYQSPCSDLAGAAILTLRESCNKIMHFTNASYRICGRHHELLLLGERKRKRTTLHWLAVLSVSGFCREVRRTPDRPMPRN